MLRFKGTKIEKDISIDSLCQVAYNTAYYTPIRGSATPDDWALIILAILDKLDIETTGEKER